MQDHELSASLSGTVTLGKELTVHRLGFGAMRITGNGVWGAPKDPNEAVRVLRRAVELGVNFIDTADSYGPDVSEDLIAEALAPYPKGVVVATKRSRFSLPISSSPSMSMVRLIGSPPDSCQTVMASTLAQTCPLSSTAPRA